MKIKSVQGHKIKSYFSYKKNRNKTVNNKTSKISEMIRKLYDNTIGLVFLSVGLLYLIPTAYRNIRIGFALIFIATSLFFLLTSEYESTPYQQKQYTPPYYQKKFQRDFFRKKLQTMSQKIRSISLSNKISIALILWTVLLFIFINDIEIYFALLFIGVLITREITDIHTSNTYKKQLDIYIIVFLLLYIVLISQKIIEYLSSLKQLP
jgi:hypothetical protein